MHFPKRTNPRRVTSPQRTIFLLRHPEVDNPASQRRYIGHTDLPLNETGRSQAAAWARALSPVWFDAIVCSDLRRCVQTALPIAKNRHVAIQPLRMLREVHLGAWEGLSFKDVRTSFGGEYYRRGQALADHSPPGGESFRNLAERVLPIFYQVVEHAAGPVLVVGHAGVNRVILCHILGMPLESMFRLGQDYAAMNLIEAYGDGFRVVGINIPSDAWPIPE
jgi:probable phosphoglycerate mutase